MECERRQTACASRYALHLFDYGVPVGFRVVRFVGAYPISGISRMPNCICRMGHFLLEDKADEAVPLIRDFLVRSVT